MESKWTMNVPQLGLTGTGVRLAARILSFPGLDWYLVQTVNQSAGWQVREPYEDVTTGLYGWIPLTPFRPWEEWDFVLEPDAT